jgi:hypothetical protein
MKMPKRELNCSRLYCSADVGALLQPEDRNSPTSLRSRHTQLRKARQFHCSECGGSRSVAPSKTPKRNRMVRNSARVLMKAVARVITPYMIAAAGSQMVAPTCVKA